MKRVKYVKYDFKHRRMGRINGYHAISPLMCINTLFLVEWWKWKFWNMTWYKRNFSWWYLLTSPRLALGWPLGRVMLLCLDCQAKSTNRIMIVSITNSGSESKIKEKDGRKRWSQELKYTEEIYIYIYKLDIYIYIYLPKKHIYIYICYPQQLEYAFISIYTL